MLRTMILVAFLIGAHPGAANAQAWPSRPITMVVPLAAGGPLDVLARIIAARLSEILGQQIVVENVVGAGGMTGAKRVADAAPDGYQMIFGSSGSHAQAQLLYKKPLYDAATEFAPVALVAVTPIVLIARKDLPVANFKEFLAYAKSNQKTMSFGSAGHGSATHIGCVILNMAMGTTITHVPYRGTGPAMQDLQGGRIDFLCDIITTAKPQIEAGRVKGLAIMNKDRSLLLPQLPTTVEQGVDAQAYGWAAIFLPRGTPEPIVRRLSEAVNEALETPAVRQRMMDFGVMLPARDERSPQYLEKFVISEIKKWAVPIKASGATVD